jgi:hypothetical protein
VGVAVLKTRGDEQAAAIDGGRPLWNGGRRARADTRNPSLGDNDDAVVQDWNVRRNVDPAADQRERPGVARCLRWCCCQMSALSYQRAGIAES